MGRGTVKVTAKSIKTRESVIKSKHNTYNFDNLFTYIIFYFIFGI